MHLISSLNISNRPMNNCRTRGAISLLNETRLAGEPCLLSAHDTSSPSHTRQSSNAGFRAKKHTLVITKM